MKDIGSWIGCSFWAAIFLYAYTPIGEELDRMLPNGYQLHSLDFYSANGLIGDPENVDL